MYFSKFHFMSTTKQVCFNYSHLHIILFPFLFEIISSFTFKNFISPSHILLSDCYRCLFEINFCYMTLICSKSSYLFCDSKTSMNRHDDILRLIADYWSSDPFITYIFGNLHNHHHISKSGDRTLKLQHILWEQQVEI